MGNRGQLGHPEAWSRHRTTVEQACCPPLPRPHLLSSAQPNKPSLFTVTFNAVPTESHTSPNPAKICTKLNQSILEMALVSFCQRTVCRGWRDQEGPSGSEDWGGGAWGLSLLETSRAVAASGGVRGGGSGSTCSGTGGQTRVPGMVNLLSPLCSQEPSGITKCLLYTG